MTLTDNARALRRRMTDAETKLWRSLRGQALGVKFRRQAPIGPYIVDFACFEPRVVIEADGGQHAGSLYDEQRDAYLRSRGFKVLRFWNHDILRNLEGVLQVIQAVLAHGTPHPDLPPPGKGTPGEDFGHQEGSHV